MAEMDTIGFIGIGKIGLPICAHLIKAGYRVLGYSRRAVTEFENSGGTPARSPEQIGAQANIVFACLPSDQALEEVMRGADGLICTAHPGQIVVELGSHPIRVKQRYIAPLADKGAIFLDGEVSGTPGMVAERKSAVYIAGDAKACATAAEVVKGFSESCTYFGKFGSAIQVKLIANLLVTLNIAASAEAMALALKTGIDPNLLINAVGSGAGSSRQFVIRAPWMAERKFFPAPGPVATLSHYFEPIKSMAAQLGVATPMLDRAITLYETALAQGRGEQDVACLVDVIGALPRK